MNLAQFRNKNILMEEPREVKYQGEIKFENFWPKTGEHHLRELLF